MWPHRWQPTRLPRPWDFPGKNTGVGCHFLLQWMKVKSKSEVAQLCPTLHDPMDCSPPGSSVHGIFQARVLEWGIIASSGNSPWGHSITGKQQWLYWLISITTRPGPAQQATVYVLVLGLTPNNWRGQTQPCPSAGTPLDTWGLHVWAKLQLHPPRTGTRSKKIRIYHAGQALTWDLLGPDHAHWAGQPKLWDPPHTHPLLNCINKYSPPIRIPSSPPWPKKQSEKGSGLPDLQPDSRKQSATSGLALTPGPGFTCQWVGSSPESLGPRVCPPVSKH